MNQFNIHEFQDLLESDREDGALFDALRLLRNVDGREEFASVASRPQPFGSWAGWHW
ncbi:MAG: hypothetical protein ACRDHL_10270 [Candidatus Promineifilaceae bacterium]